MDSIKIDIDIQGQKVVFAYSQRQCNKSVWMATITDECRTIEESFVEHTPDECLDGLVSLLKGFGTVLSISSNDGDRKYVTRLEDKLRKAA